MVPKGSLRGGPSRHRGLANSNLLQPLLFSSATLAPSPSPQPQPKTTFLGNPDTGHWRSERGIAYLKLRPVEFGAMDLGAGNDSGNPGTQASDKMTYLETGTARNWALGTGNQELGARNWGAIGENFIPLSGSWLLRFFRGARFACVRAIFCGKRRYLRGILGVLFRNPQFHEARAQF